MLKTFGLSSIAVFLCAFFGFALQIQMTIGQSAESFGLRVNLGDMALPLVGVLVLGALLLRKTALPRWHLPLGLFWPVALTGLLCFAMWNGHHITGAWSHWALINKFIGWFVLMAYFGLGAWLATNFGQGALKVLLKVFLLTSIIVSTAHFIYIVLTDFRLVPSHAYYQLTGFMGNRNAMGLLLIFTFSILIAFAASGRAIIHPWLYRGFMLLLPLIVIYNESRAVWVAIFIPVLGVLYFFRKNALKSLMLPAAALLVTLLSLAIIDRAELSNRNLRSGDMFIQHNEETIYTGDYQRMRVLTDSLEFWKQHPVTGIGLGSFIHMQDQKRAGTETVALGIIDSSPLWVVTEFGIIGSLLFCGFYLISLHTLKKTNNPDENEYIYASLRTAMFLFLIAFAAMSLFHELIYTRFIWFFLGLTLAISREELKSVRANP
jgi:hypothetical protein